MVARKRMSRIPRGGIPALTLSGGRLKRFADAKEYRVWVHPRSGDDFYYSFQSPLSALGYAVKAHSSGDYVRVEKPLAVVWDSAKGDWREVDISPELYAKGMKATVRSLGYGGSYAKKRKKA
jgi:hypothetical protein